MKLNKKPLVLVGIFIANFALSAELPDAHKAVAGLIGNWEGSCNSGGSDYKSSLPIRWASSFHLQVGETQYSFDNTITDTEGKRGQITGQKFNIVETKTSGATWNPQTQTLKTNTAWLSVGEGIKEERNFFSAYRASYQIQGEKLKTEELAWYAGTTVARTSCEYVKK